MSLGCHSMTWAINGASNRRSDWHLLGFVARERHRGRVIDLEQPRPQLRVEHHVEPEDLEAAPLLRFGRGWNLARLAAAAVAVAATTALAAAAVPAAGARRARPRRLLGGRWPTLGHLGVIKRSSSSEQSCGNQHAFGRQSARSQEAISTQSARNHTFRLNAVE